MALRELNNEEINIYSEMIAKDEQVDFNPSDLTEESRSKLFAAIDEARRNISNLENRNQNEERFNDDAMPAGPKTLQGAVLFPDGYEHIGTMTAIHDDGSEKINVTNVLPNASVSKSSDALSLTFNRGTADPTQGYLEGRIINDSGGRFYVFRKDDAEAGTTFFHGTYSSQPVPNTVPLGHTSLVDHEQSAPVITGRASYGSREY